MSVGAANFNAGVGMAERWMTVQGVVNELLRRWDSKPNESTVRRWLKRGQFAGAVRTHDGWKVPQRGLESFLRRRTPSDT